MGFPLRLTALTAATSVAVLAAGTVQALTVPDGTVQRSFVVPGAQVSALVVSPERGTEVYVNATTPLPPASTTKLYTVGSALALLGANHRFTTKAVITSAGDLVIQAGGDPTLTRTDLNNLAKAIKAGGVTTVRGALRIDDTLFDRVRGGYGWRASYVGGEAGPLSAMMVDHNLWKPKDKAFLKDPLPATLALLKKDLKAAGVGVAGPLGEGPAAAPVTRIVATHLSAPLSRIAAHTLQRSDNTEAEMLLKQVAVATGKQGSSNVGVQAVIGLARSWGVTMNGRLADGSGLSRASTMDAATTVAWLHALDAHGIGAVMRRSLPVSCDSGTLQHRLCGAWLTGRVTAKTGTLDYTSALAGWARTRSGDEVAFAVTVNGPRDYLDAKAVDAAMTSLLRSKSL